MATELQVFVLIQVTVNAPLVQASPIWITLVLVSIWMQPKYLSEFWASDNETMVTSWLPDVWRYKVLAVRQWHLHQSPVNTCSILLVNY